MKTFCVQTLGCKVNQYESRQVASLLRDRGLSETSAAGADLRIINTCSVTVQAASRSRQSVRRMTRLPVLPRPVPADRSEIPKRSATAERAANPDRRGRVIVIGCWATGDRACAAGIPGVDAVITHQDDLPTELDRLLSLWRAPERESDGPSGDDIHLPLRPASDHIGDGNEGASAGDCTSLSKTESTAEVKQIPSLPAPAAEGPRSRSLPVADCDSPLRQRAYLKVQDGCDACCTYCIIPRLRTRLSSKPAADAVAEARRLVERGHVEIVLTGIFLGAYGQPTALRRRQSAQGTSLASLVAALCDQVAGLKRLRLSSLEPGDLNDELLDVLASHPQIAPHFHLPLQSGSSAILRRMNRQYDRDEFLRMIDRVRVRFDRPAITTDIIVGFPGESDAEFDRTLDAVDRCRFIQIHAFPFSPRPGTAAVRWTDQFVRGPIVRSRMETLADRAARHSLEFRLGFVGRDVEVIAETERPEDPAASGLRHGRCERYFSVHFDSPGARPGDAVRVRIERVTPTRTFGRPVTESGR